MSDQLEAMGKLSGLANKLDILSRELGRVNRELRPLQEEYDEFINDYEAGLYDSCEENGKSLPGEKMRLTLALREMPKEFRGKHHRLIGERDSLKQQIANLKAEIDAWRSVLSANKAELEAVS